MGYGGFGGMGCGGMVGMVLLLAVLIGVCAALYSIVHVEKFPTKSAAMYHPFLLLFVGGMYGILSITDTMWFFCAFWQLMTIPSFILMLFESEKPGIKPPLIWRYVMDSFE